MFNRFNKLNNTIANNRIVDRNKINNKVMLFTNARDENRIVEWISHHLNLGFDNIVIFDHKSVIPIKYLISPDVSGVSVFRVKGEGNIKVELMKTAVKISIKNNVDWMLYLDADEYLCLNKFSNVKEMLRFFKEADLLCINWLMFGSNNHIQEPTEGLLIENYTKSDEILNQHVKSFVRPVMVTGVENPHYYLLISNNRILCMPMRKMYYPSPFNEINISYKNVGAFIAHYFYQSEETYIKRKISIIADDGTSKTYDKNFHEHYNNYENTTLKDKYSDKIKITMDKIKMKN